jgi:hypothetical protein
MHVVFWLSSLLLIITTLVVHHKIDPKKRFDVEDRYQTSLMLLFTQLFKQIFIIATSHAMAY